MCTISCPPHVCRVLWKPWFYIAAAAAVNVAVAMLQYRFVTIQSCSSQAPRSLVSFMANKLVFAVTSHNRLVQTVVTARTALNRCNAVNIGRKARNSIDTYRYCLLKWL